MGREAVAVLGLSLVLLAGAVPLAAGPAATHTWPRGAPPASSALSGMARAVEDPATGGGTGRMVVNTTDPDTVPNSGVQTNITAFASTPLPDFTSFQVSATEAIGAFDAVFGIFENDVHLPVPFFAVFNNSSDLLIEQYYWPSLPLFEGDPYDFQLAAVNATYWELTVNGEVFADNDSQAYFDFGTGVSNWLPGLLFSEITYYPGSSPVPSFVNIPLALAVRQPTGWYLPTEGSTWFSGSGGPPWGVEGRIQHPTLAPGELDTGTSLAPLANGTALWTGGPVAVRVALTLSASTTIATTQFLVTAVVDDTSGAPVPGASLFVGDSLGGYSLVTPLVTNGSGGIEDVLQLPNVSTSTADLIQATVTSFGYSGSSGASVELTPPVQLFLSVAGLPSSLAPTAEVTFSVLVTDAAGDPVPGASIDFSTIGAGGQVTPGTAVTGTDGTVSELFVAASVASALVVDMNITGAGVWGHATVDVSVQTPAPSFWSLYGPDIEGAIGLAVAAVAVGLIVRWSGGRRRRPLPPPTGIEWGAPTGSRGSGATAPPTTRRPPSAGAP